MTPPLLALRQVEEEMRQVRVEDGGPASGVALPHQCDRWAARLRGAIEGIEAMTREVVEIADEIEGKSWPGGYPIKAERVLEFVRRLKKAVKP